jgi:hypothetical protein
VHLRASAENSCGISAGRFVVRVVISGCVRSTPANMLLYCPAFVFLGGPTGPDPLSWPPQVGERPRVAQSGSSLNPCTPFVFCRLAPGCGQGSDANSPSLNLEVADVLVRFAQKRRTPHRLHTALMQDSFGWASVRSEVSATCTHCAGPAGRQRGTVWYPAAELARNSQTFCFHHAPPKPRPRSLPSP